MVKQIPMHGSVLITHMSYLERMQHRAWLARFAIQERRWALGILPCMVPRVCEAQRRCMLAIGGLPRGLEDSVLEAVIAAVLDSCAVGDLTNDHAL